MFWAQEKLEKLPGRIQSSGDINTSFHQLLQWICSVQLANYVDDSSDFCLHSALTFPRTITKQNYYPTR